MEVQFCNDHLITDNIVKMIHSLILNLPEKDIARIYEMFCEVYNAERELTSVEYKSAIFFDKHRIDLIKNYAVNETDTHMGVDFPTWFNFSDAKPKIILVGMDPLRAEPCLRDVISIGTPYNLHTLHGDKKLEKNLYWQLISQLSQNFSVYVTDTFKVFFHENGNLNKKSNRCKRFTNPAAENWQEEIHQRIFSTEIDIIQPKAIVTLGTTPVRWFTGCKKQKFEELNEMVSRKDKLLEREGIPVIPLMHLSGKATKNALKLYSLQHQKQLPSRYISIILEFFKV